MGENGSKPFWGEKGFGCPHIADGGHKFLPQIATVDVNQQGYVRNATIPRLLP